MKKQIIILSISVSMLVLPTIRCHAQRTVPGQWTVSADCSITANVEGLSPSAKVGLGRYTASGIISAALQAGYNRHKVTEEVYLELPSVQTEAGYAFRIAGSYTRSVSLYMNSSIIAGLQFPDPYGRLPHWIESDLPSSIAYTEVSLGPSLEIFMTRKIAATLTLSANTRTADIQHCPSVKTSLGVRVNI